MKFILSILLVLYIVVTSCSSLRDGKLHPYTINKLTYIDELIISEDLVINGDTLGGLSSLDYHNTVWYALSDDKVHPRFYTLDLPYTSAGFKDFTVKDAHLLKDRDGQPFELDKVDPEAMRVYDAGQLVWASEGFVSKEVQPFIRLSSMTGQYIDSIALPARYLSTSSPNNGPRDNGVFEALSKDYKSGDLWVATELPLKEDGLPPTSSLGNVPVRIGKINMKNKTFDKEYVYLLDNVQRSGKVEVNGVTELLSIGPQTLLVLERSYASGYDDGGNNVSLYKITIEDATDVSDYESLKKATYTPVTKTLLLDFEDIRSQISSGMVDNIEGMTFGPTLANGHRTLVFISDNNFNTYGKQLTQVLLFEIE